MKQLALALFATLFAMLGSAADAGNAYTQGEVHLRAGPSTDYPIVMSIPPSSLLTVNGCLDDFTWCDVDWEGNHGWLYGSYLYYDYQQRRVPVLDVGAALGIGIVAFNLGDYWGRYYVGRPWYARRSYWINRPPPPRRPPPLRPRPPYLPGRPSHGGPARPPPPRPARPTPSRPPTPPRPTTPTPSPRPDRPSNPGNAGRPGGTGGAGGSGGPARPGGAGATGGSRPAPRPSTRPAPRPSSPQPDNKPGPGN